MLHRLKGYGRPWCRDELRQRLLSHLYTDTKRGPEGMHEMEGHYSVANTWEVMTVVLLNRIRNAVDRKPRREQAGFRPGRSCC